jgi:hypothetical protein
MNTQNWPHEVKALLSLRERPPHISQLEAFTAVSGYQIVYYAFGNAGDLGSLINGYQERNEMISEAFIWHVTSQLVKAVDFIQNPPPESTQHPITHADIKP